MTKHNYKIQPLVIEIVNDIFTVSKNGCSGVGKSKKEAFRDLRRTLRKVRRQSKEERQIWRVRLGI